MWTALAAVPTLTADGFWPEHAWAYGGGVFVADGRLVLQETTRDRHPDDRQPSEVTVVRPRRGHGIVGDPATTLLHATALTRDGWRPAEPLVTRGWGSTTWEREAPGGWKVRKLFFDAGTPERNLLVPPDGGVPLLVDGFAGVDGDRLVWCTGYEIRAGVPGPRAIEDERVLVDLAAWRFERRGGRDPRAGSC